MSQENGVIRIGRKGIKKFAFGEEGTPGGAPFEVDVVVSFQKWIGLDDSFRQEDGKMAPEDVAAWHQTALDFVKGLAPQNPAPEWAMNLTIAEALDFIARLREQWDELVVFFHPKKRGEDESPATLAGGLEFSEEPAMATAEGVQGPVGPVG